jgi:hypothetical protein
MRKEAGESEAEGLTLGKVGMKVWTVIKRFLKICHTFFSSGFLICKVGLSVLNGNRTINNSELPVS